MRSGKGWLILFLGVFLQSCSTAPRITFPSPLEEAPSQEAPVWRGVFHVHTHYSDDSGGSLKDVFRAARREKLDFVVITDHNTLGAKFDESLAQPAPSPLLIVGEEISTQAGHLIALGIEKAIETPIGAQEAIEAIHEQKGWAVLAHPICKKKAWKDWSVKDFDGMEIYNYSCDFYGRNRPTLLLRLLLLPPSVLVEQLFQEPRETLERWDSFLEKRPVAGLGGVNAHVRFGRFGLALFRYSLSFPAVTMYVFAESLSEKAILQALFSGQSFVAFETRGRAEGFSFKARVEGKQTTLVVKVPKSAEIRLLRNGVGVQKTKGEMLLFEGAPPGVYRVEVFRRGKLWILSHPIVIQA